MDFNYEQGSLTPLEAQRRSKALLKVLKSHPALNEREDRNNIVQFHDGNPPKEHPNGVATLTHMLIPLEKGTRAVLMDIIEKNEFELSWWIDRLKENGGWEALKNLEPVVAADYPAVTVEATLLDAGKKYFEKSGIEVRSTKEVVGAQGMRHILNAYAAIMQKEGRCKIFAPTPHYGSFNEVLADRDVEIVQIVTQEPGRKLTPELLEEYAVKHPDTKELLLTNPNNPSGSMYMEDELRALGAKAKELGIFFLVDEIYVGEELKEGQKTVSYASLDPEFYNNSLTMIGLGKTYADAADRIGVAVTGNEEIAQTIIGKSVRGTTSSPATASQYSAAMVLRYTPEEFLEQNREFYRERLNLVRELIEETNQKLAEVGSDVRIKPLVEPEAGFYIMVEFENTKGRYAYDGEVINNSLKLVEHVGLSGITNATAAGGVIGKPGITLLDGDSLGISDTISARINFAKPSEEELRAGFGRLGDSLVALTKERKPERSYEAAKNVKAFFFPNEQQHTR